MCNAEWAVQTNHLHENEVRSDNVLDHLLLPEVSVLRLRGEVGDVNHVDHQELLLINCLLGCLVRRDDV